jgi:hypothetical protein
VRIVPLAILLAILLATPAASNENEPSAPKLLLSVKLAKRLKRDRERQTPRWVNFENRVKTVPDSPERGFELALYYAVTGDAARAREAIGWVLAHPREIRQRALVLDWCGEAATTQERSELAAGLVRNVAINSFQDRRDCLFVSLEMGKDAGACAGTNLKNGSLLSNPAELYAACEYFITARRNGLEDQRRDDPEFFQHLPVEFLLARRPEEVEQPDWRSHVAALALVSLDPNLEASQFLQGWAIEDRQTLRQGPGVAYELLWADPYLPGIAYQNLDPWLYEAGGGRLFAREDWTPGTCWIAIADGSVEQQGCPAGWRQKVMTFGSMKLMAFSGKCLEVAHQDMKESMILWQLKPGGKITYHDNKDISAQADAAGMWRIGSNVEGKVCQAR